MKKLVSIVFVLVLTLTLCTPAFAEISTYVTGADERDSRLSISGTTAICKSIYTANGDDVKQVLIAQSLEKQGFLWKWDVYEDNIWLKTSDGSSTSFTNTVSGLEKGKYRVRTVFTVFDSSGKSETTTLYSTTENIG